MTVSEMQLEQGRDHCCSIRCAIGLDVTNTGGAVDLVGDQRGHVIGVGIAVLEAPPGVVPVESSPDVEVLLEVVTQRNVDERHLARRQLHCRGEATLHDRDVRTCKVAVEPIDVRSILDAVD